jgi:hypothetical protein
MRSRDLIDGFDYNEHMQRQMFCFGSSDDTGSSGPDRSNPNEMRAREQNFVDTRYGGDSDSFMSDVAAGAYSGLAAEEQAAAEAQAMAGLGNVASDRGVDAAAVNAALNNIAAASVSTASRATEKDYGTPDPTQEQISQLRGFDTGTQASRDAIMGLGQLSEIDALKQLNADLYELSRAEQRMKDMMSYSPIAGYVGLQNVRNLAQLASGYPTGFLSSLGLADRYVGPGRTPAELAALQSRNLRGPTGRDPFGRTTSGIKAITDEFGNVIQGVDPRPDILDTQGGYDDRPPVKPVDPATGQCDEGYMFDEDMQACRLDTRSSMGGQPSLPQVPFQPGGYARMGLLDEAPTNLPQFQQRYGAGFGSPSDFAAANTAFRQQSAYRPEYFKRPYPTDGYTLLS